MQSSTWRHITKTLGEHKYELNILLDNLQKFNCRTLLKEAGLNDVVPVAHMNEHGSNRIKARDVAVIFQK